MRVFGFLPIHPEVCFFDTEECTGMRKKRSFCARNRNRKKHTRLKKRFIKNVLQKLKIWAKTCIWSKKFINKSFREHQNPKKLKKFF